MALIFRHAYSMMSKECLELIRRWRSEEANTVGSERPLSRGSFSIDLETRRGIVFTLMRSGPCSEL